MKPEGPSRTGRRMNTKAHRKNARVRNRPHRRHWFKRLPLQAQLAILDAAELAAYGAPLNELVFTLPDGEPDPVWMEEPSIWIQEYADSSG